MVEVWGMQFSELPLQLPTPVHKHSAMANFLRNRQRPTLFNDVSAHAYETLVVLSALLFIGGGGGGGFFALDGGGGGACFLPFGADVSVE